MSRRKSGVSVHGILLLDKRLAVSSNKALQEVKRLFNANKAGHTGNLDLLASGLLPLCFGEATKVSGLMLDDDKRYLVDVKLGVMTNTGDLEGEVIASKPVPSLTDEQVKTCLEYFTGEIEQVPPMHSALKFNGKKLYELARDGIEIERKARCIRIYELKLISRTVDVLTLEVFCSKGTYIRSLAEDIGHYFECGGTVTMLRRLQSGIFDLAQAYTLEQLVEMTDEQRLACLLPVDAPLRDLPIVYLSEVQAKAISYGQSVDYSGLHQKSVRLYDKELFLGLGEIGLNGKLCPKRLFDLNN